MNKKIILLLLWIFATVAQAQQKESDFSFDRYISDSLWNTNPNGVYLTHQDFLNGKPSIQGKFEVVRASAVRNEFSTYPTLYVLRIYDPVSNKMRIYNEPFWCSLTDEGMYVMHGKDIYRLAYAGRFNICTTSILADDLYSKIRRYNPSEPGANTFYSTVIKSKERKIIDFKTNKWYDYSVRGMKILLKENSRRLYEAFTDEFNKKRKLTIYFHKINGKG